MSDAKSSGRIAVVDGWRALAVLGVFWWHSWIHTGNPPLHVSAGETVVNLQRLLVLLGNGVDLFFVLSGFCIYQSITRSLPVLTASGYGRFVLNRWRRLSPAFYVVCVVTAGALWISGVTVSLTEFVAHFLWSFNIWPGVWQLSPPFWSLQVEWEFYLLAPLLLLIRSQPLRWKVLGVLLLASWVVRCWLHDTPDGVAQVGINHLPMHFSAFVFGIAVAEAWRTRAPWLLRLNGPLALVTGLAVAFVGRGLVSTEVFASLGRWGVPVKALGDPIMTFGFALMLAGTLAGVRGVETVLTSAPLQTVGRLSYSLYLWHWWPCVWIGHVLIARLGSTVTAHYLTLAATLAISLPLAWLTYRFCERPYFRPHSPTPVTGSASVDAPAQSGGA